jgi:hypothetical protein
VCRWILASSRNLASNPSCRQSGGKHLTNVMSLSRTEARRFRGLFVSTGADGNFHQCLGRLRRHYPVVGRPPGQWAADSCNGCLRTTARVDWSPLSDQWTAALEVRVHDP